jgi:HAD superfamily phosphoserine phosphatase-like hydrolase
MKTKKTKARIARAAFFDVAGTLTLLPMFIPFGRVLVKRGLFPAAEQAKLEAAYAAYKTGRINESEYVPRFKRIQARGFKGKRRAAVRRAAQAYFRAKRFGLRSFAKPLASLLRSRGYRVVLVSGSLAEEIAPIARFLGADAFFAQTLAVGSRGRFTGRYSLVAATPLAKAKIARAYARRESVDLKRSLAFGDMHLDERKLALVGRAVALNAVPGFKKRARSRKWFVIARNENVVKRVSELLDSLD